MSRFLHTADWQIGRLFQTLHADNAVPLAEARLSAVERLAALATAHRGYVLELGRTVMQGDPAFEADPEQQVDGDELVDRVRKPQVTPDQRRKKSHGEDEDGDGREVLQGDGAAGHEAGIYMKLISSVKLLEI